jgi:hypothetical protein
MFLAGQISVKLLDATGRGRLGKISKHSSSDVVLFLRTILQRRGADRKQVDVKTEPQKDSREECLLTRRAVKVQPNFP